VTLKEWIYTKIEQLITLAISWATSFNIPGQRVEIVCVQLYLARPARKVR